MLVMDKHDYTHKAQRLLYYTSSYRQLTADPTNKHKAKLINLLRKIKIERGLDDMHTATCTP